jgi:hypothetical protein
MRVDDTILVAINPVERPDIPRSACDILNRVSEVSFNAVLLKELRMIALLRQVADAAHWAAMRIHMIGSQMLVDLGSSSKLNAEWPFLSMLRDEGRRAAEGFLSAHGEALGRGPRSTLTLAARENLDPEEAKLKLLGEKQPSLEFTRPEQLGALAAFLCSDAAAQLNGVALPVDGGWVAR